jgi:MFS family permease
MDLSQLIRPRKKLSYNRASLRVATHEGFPAIVIVHLIGGPFLTAYLLYLGASSAQIGLALAIPPLANIVQIFIALYMHRFENRRRSLFIFASIHRIAWVLTGIIPFFFMQEQWVFTYIIIYFISFISASIGGVIWSSLIADIVPAQIRGRYFGIRNTLLWAVASLTLLIGGQILERFPGSVGFGILYSISAVCVIWNMVMLWKYPNPSFERSQELDKFKQLLIPFKDTLFIRAVLFISLFILLQNTAIPLFSYVMLDIMNVSIQWISVITTVHLIVMMISYYFWGNLNARYATRKLIFWTFPILSFSVLLWAGLSILPVLLVLFLIHILLGIGIGGSNLLLFNFIIGDTPKSDRPMYIAVFSALTGLTGFIGPLLGGYMYKMTIGLPYWVQSYGIFSGVGTLLMILTFIGTFIFRKGQ